MAEPAKYRQFWVHKSLRPKIRDWFGLVPRFKSGYDTDFGGEIFCDLPVISPHRIPQALRAMDLYIDIAEIAQDVIDFVHEEHGRVIDEKGDPT
jgi:hypothetical protein